MRAFIFLASLVLILTVWSHQSLAGNFVRQTDISSCGPDVLREVLRMRGLSIADTEASSLLDELYPETIEERKTYGASFSEMSTLVERYLGRSAILTADVSDAFMIAAQIDILVAIKTATTTHFVILSSIGQSDELMIVDPLFGVAVVSKTYLKGMLSFGNQTGRFTFIPLIGTPAGKSKAEKIEHLSDYDTIKALGKSETMQTFSFGASINNSTDVINFAERLETLSTRNFLEYRLALASKQIIYSIKVGVEESRLREKFSIGQVDYSSISESYSAYFDAGVEHPFSFSSSRAQLDGAVYLSAGQKKKFNGDCNSCENDWAQLGLNLSFALSRYAAGHKEIPDDRSLWYHSSSISVSSLNDTEQFNAVYGLNHYEPKSRITFSGNVYAFGPELSQIDLNGISLSVRKTITNQHSISAEFLLNRDANDNNNASVVISSYKEHGINLNANIALSGPSSVGFSLQYNFQK